MWTAERGPIRGIQVQGNDAAARALEPWLASVKEQGVATLSLATTRASDHAAFDAVGLPAFDLIQDSSDFAATRHSSADTYDRLQRPILVRNAALVASFVLLPRQPRRADAAKAVAAAGPEGGGPVVAR